MTSCSLNRLATIWWVTLLVCVAVLFIFLLLTPEVALFGSTSERDAEIHSIKSETDASRLQKIAVMYVSVGYGTGTTATLLCRIALGTLLVVIAGSVTGLVQVRRIRRKLDETKNVA